MRRVFALAGVLLFCTQGAVAQNVAAPGPAAKAVERVMTLGNGMKVVVAEKHLAPIVETDVFYHFGSGDETAGKTGLAHALEHMMFRGTKEISYAGLNELYAHFGARINGRTNEDFTQFYEIAPSAALGTILRVEADRMQHLALLAKDWNTERGAVLSEIDGDLANPLGRFTIAVRRAIFQGSGYELPAFGVRADVARATVDDLRKYYSEWYAPNNAILVVVGDVRTEDVFALAKA
ncbi:MAG: insulinase family protein, partial [Candidatus Eremiobacteraeota bacterium]|nr:insulinase family protein [Candidatus Eremiobacteraeota bacterium]